MHLNSRLLFEKYALDYFQPGLKVLEIGPNELPSIYQKLAQKPGVQWDTIDIQNNPQLTYRMTGEYEFPIPTGTYDVVVSGQVLEHVKKIWVWMREISRVCKVGGTVISINPLSYGYHESPVDCWRVYPEGMRALYDDCGLDPTMSCVEALEPTSLRIKQYFHVLRRLVLLKPAPRFGFPPIQDTITIGRKRPAAKAA